MWDARLRGAALLYDPNIVRVLLVDGRFVDVPREARCAHRRFSAYGAPSYALVRLGASSVGLPVGVFALPGVPEFEAQLGPAHAFRGELVLVELKPGAGQWWVSLVETQAQALARAESEILRLVAKPSSPLH